MQENLSRWLRDVPAAPARVAAILFLFLLSFLAADHALHHRLHPDASNPEHVCVLTLLAQGQIEAPEAADAVIPSNPLLQPLPAPVTPVRATALRLPPSCGPPVA